MQRERADLLVEVAGRRGEVLRHSEDGLKMEVRFEDGDTEWIDVSAGERAREEARQSDFPARELGS